MLALALFALSIACLLSAPIALAVAVALTVWGAVSDVEVAIVVSKRRPDGRKGQQTIVSARTTPRRAARAVGVAAAGAVGAVRAVAAGARGAAARWAETEQAARLADRARTLADVGPAALTLTAVWALPWIAITAPDGAAAAAGVCAALALARHLTAAGGLRYRVDG